MRHLECEACVHVQARPVIPRSPISSKARLRWRLRAPGGRVACVLGENFRMEPQMHLCSLDGLGSPTNIEALIWCIFEI